MPDENLEKLPFETLLKMIENSEGTRIFNSAFVKDKRTGRIIDVLNDGEYSCAVFVSGLLSLVGLIDRPHSTVKTLVSKLEESNNWEKIEAKIEPGDVLVWEKVKFEDGSENEHIGFAIDDLNAISTNYIEKRVVKHPAFKKVNGKDRKIEKIYRFRT